YEMCPKQYYYKYVLEIPSPSTQYMVYGSALHEAIATYHLSNSLNDSIDSFNLSWENAFISNTVSGFRNKEQINKMHQNAINIVIPDFVTRKQKEKEENPLRKVIHVESPFEVQYEDIIVRGIYDLVEQ